MNKGIKKLLAGVFVVNLSILGAGFIPYTNALDTVHADQASDISIQRDELNKAVNDSDNVVNSLGFTNYASQESKDAYLRAIANGKKVLGLGNDASFDLLSAATFEINSAKDMIKNDAADMVKIESLRKAVENNKIQSDAARNLLENYPNTVRNVKEKLEKLIIDSEAYIKRANAILAQYE